MITPINAVAPIIYDELYVRNAVGLKNVELCPFLKYMDECEHLLQQRRIQTPPYLKDSYKFAPLAGIVGAILGGLMTGGLGFTAFFCGIGGLALSGEKVPKLKAAKEKLSMRISRVAQKIALIQNERFNLTYSSDARQLELAQSHFERVLSNYQRKLSKKYSFDSDSDSDTETVSLLNTEYNVSLFTFGERR